MVFMLHMPQGCAGCCSPAQQFSSGAQAAACKKTGSLSYSKWHFPPLPTPSIFASPTPFFEPVLITAFKGWPRHKLSTVFNLPLSPEAPGLFKLLCDCSWWHAFWGKDLVFCMRGAERVMPSFRKVRLFQREVLFCDRNRNINQLRFSCSAVDGWFLIASLTSFILQSNLAPLQHRPVTLSLLSVWHYDLMVLGHLGVASFCFLELPGNTSPSL